MRIPLIMASIMLITSPVLAQEESDEGSEQTAPAKSLSLDGEADEDPGSADGSDDEESGSEDAEMTDGADASAETETPANDEEGLGLSLAPKLGFTVPTSKLGLSFFGAVEIGYRLPFARESLGGLSLHLAAELAYANPGVSGNGSSAAAGAYTYDLSQQIITLALGGFVTYPLDALTLYGGLGWGAYFLDAEIEAFELTNTESQSRGGLQLWAGAGYTLGPGHVFAELRYHFVGLEFDSTGDSNAGGMTFALGYRLTF